MEDAKQEPIDKWREACEAIERVEELCVQAEYDFWTLRVLPATEGDTCPLLGCKYENNCGVLLNNTTTPISFTYIFMVLQLSREAMVHYGSQIQGMAALKHLQDPYTRLPITRIRPVRVFDTCGIEIL
jgi:hypothetical protein